MLATKFVEPGELSRWRKTRRGSVSAVNGCFDVLHAGHVQMLQFASEFGELIVGINSDAAVRLLKGDRRPINSQCNRAEVIGAIGCVSAVTIFDAPDAAEFLCGVRPDFWIKGGDYTLATIHPAERAVVEQAGGFIRFYNLVPGLSSTRTIAAMKG